jgi:1-acyl-sn-glycerol-3-phosphate acyltransferase
MFSWGALRLLGVRMTIENRELLDDMQPSVVIANHQSNLDLFVHGGVIPKRCVSVGKSSLKFLPFFGQVYWLAGNIMINRSKSRESINTMSETTEALKNKNTSIWVFAEGTRNGGNGLLPFKKGAFHMAQQASAPIVPICASAYPKHINLNKWRAGEVIVRVLPAMDTYLAKEEDMDKLISEAHSKMKQTIEELNHKVVDKAS